jgi:ABC-2 type transport system permease protein
MNRFYGLGSVFGKSLRDARKASLGLGALIGLIVAVTAWQVGTQFDTAAERLQLASQMELLPVVLHGLVGEPINIETMPGFISWRLMGFMPVIVGLWSITALAGALAGEASRGTLELVLSMPISRARLAAQKFAAHAVALAIGLGIAALVTWLSVLAFAALPGDELGLAAALGGVSLTFAISLMAGAIAFALGPLLGRGLATGAASLYLFGAYLAHGYGDLVPGFDILRFGSAFYWTSQHRPLAGLEDWPSVALVLLLALAFGALGVWLFVKRDLASFVRLPVPARLRGRALQASGWSLGGVGRRTLGELLPTAVGTGLGLGLYGLFIALAANDFAATLNAVPQLIEMIRPLYPELDLSSGLGLLQLVAFAFMPLAIGLGTAALVQRWTADEREGRLEALLATPVARISWVLRSGTALLLVSFLIGALSGLLMALGAAIAGLQPLHVLLGGLVIGLFGAALAGVGVLVSGVSRASWAGPAVAGLAIGMAVVDMLGGVLGLPEWLVNLSLTRHLGQPIGGVYDVPGLIVSAALAAGGLAAGAIAFARRDLA